MNRVEFPEEYPSNRISLFGIRILSTLVHGPLEC